MLAKLAPALIGALVSVLLTVGGGLFVFGERLGNATAKAEFWQNYVKGLSDLPPECRR